MTFAEALRQQSAVGRVQFDQDGAVLSSQHAADDEGRAGISVRPMPNPRAAQHLAIGRKEVLDLGLERLVEAPHPALPFERARRLAAAEIIEADARMRIDGPERLVLEAQVAQDPHQQRVLHHVREVAGVEGVAVVHRFGAVSGPRSR